MTQCETYARWVLNPENEKRTGRLIKLAAQRFLSDLEREDIYFDEAEANKIVYFGEGYCCLWEDKWRGKPVHILPWMAFVLQQIYGWFRRSDGLRRVTKVYIQVSKKNAKTTLAGIVSNFHLFADERVQTPKIYVGANNEDQAKLCVNITGKIIEQSPKLYEYVEDGDVNLFKYKENIVNIVHRERDGFCKALSKETSDLTSSQAGGKHGINPSLGVIDEYAMADTDALLNTLESAQAARSEPLIFVITTAGFKKEGPCYMTLRGSGIEVLEGTATDDSFLVFIYEIDKPIGEDGKAKTIDLDYLENNEEVWEQSNPSIDVSVSRQFLRQRITKAKNEGGTKIVDVKTLNFDEWCDTPEVWVPHETWLLNSHDISLDSLRGRTCYAGIEITSGLTLNSFSLFFPNISGDLHAVRCMFWMPSDAIQSKNMPKDMVSWADDGLIEVCQGNVIDNDFIVSKIIDMCTLYNVHSLAFNITLSNHDILQALIRNGMQCSPLSTGYKGQSTPTKLWEELLTSAKIEHFNNPVLAWMNGHTIVNKNKEGDIRVEKSEGRTAGITASINALAQWKSVMANEPDDAKIESW